MTSGRVLAFGEVILRLSPPRGELLLQSGRLDVWVAGAEANVATQLATLGHQVALATRLPEQDLGRAALAQLRGRGIDVESIALGGDRIGLYFVTPGAGVRSTEVMYDRAGSAFAETNPSQWHWDRLLSGVDRLHLSGITPALGPLAAESAVAAAEAAAERGIPVSFDGNWRGKLWSRWNADPRAILDRIVRHCDLLFGDHRDIALLLGRESDGEPEGDRLERAAEAAFAAYPALKAVAATTRRTLHASHHVLGGMLATRDGCVRADEVEILDVVDRVGSGDAFVAGVLHGLLNGDAAIVLLRTAIGLAALKHTVVGDASNFTEHDLAAFASGQRDVRR